MKYAKTTKAFTGAPDGVLVAKDFAIGDIVEGGLAEVAIAQGWAEETEAPKPKPDDEPAPAPTPEPVEDEEPVDEHASRHAAKTGKHK